MKVHVGLVIAGLMVLVDSGVASAKGELNIYNWGNYTSPDLIKKFEDTYDVEVTITDFDSLDTALAKVRAGGHGFDVVVPSAASLPVWISEGLLLESRPDQMENFKNIDPKWVDVPFDPGRHYSVPWQWGSTGVSVNGSVYSGNINTSAIFLDPPPELVGKINVVPEMSDVLALAVPYVGGEYCTGDLTILKKVRDKLLEAKPKWKAIDYPTAENFVKGDYAAGIMWGGASYRIRMEDPDIAFGYPQEGYPVWMDNVAILADAKNVENARLFLNFLMDPQNAAMISAYARYANGILGSDAYLPDDMKNAPEIQTPEEFKAAGRFVEACPPEVQELYTKIWTEVLK